MVHLNILDKDHQLLDLIAQGCILTLQVAIIILQLLKNAHSLEIFL